MKLYCSFTYHTLCLLLLVWMTMLIFDFPSAALTVCVWPTRCRCLEQPKVPILTRVTDWQRGQTQGEWCIVCLTAPQPSGMPWKSWESLTFKAGRLSESDGKRGVKQTQGPVSILLLCGIPIPPKTPSNRSDGQEREGRAQPGNSGVSLLSSAMAQVAQVALRIWAGMGTSEEQGGWLTGLIRDSLMTPQTTN